MENVCASSGSRIKFIDTAKALAIFLVIIGHCQDTPHYISSLIYTFHMPLFFIISGLFIKPMSAKNGMRKYSQSYLFPYFVLAGLIFVIDLLANTCSETSIDFPFLRNEMYKIIWASNYPKPNLIFGEMPSIGPAWFLFGLFWACFFVSFSEYYFKKLAAILVITCLSLISICSIKRIELPFSLQAGLLASTYILIGLGIKHYNILDKINEIPLAVKILCILLWLTLPFFIGGVDIGSANLGYSVCGFILSLIGQ